MNTIWIIPIEPIDQRYTKQWYDNIPVILEEQAGSDYKVVTVDGEDFAPEQRTEGAFLDFGATNVYKATQTAEVSKLFSNGKVKAGDKLKLEINLSKILKDDKFKKTTFHFEIISIEEKIKFELTKEFLDKNGFKTEKDLRDFLVSNMKTQYEQGIKQIEKKELMDLLDNSYKFELPEGVLEDDFNQIWNRLEEAKKEGNLDEDDKLLKDDDLKKRYKKISERRVKLGLLMQHIASEEKVVVSEEEINKGILEYTRQYPGQEKQIMEYFEKNPSSLDTIRAPLIEQKVIDSIISKSKTNVIKLNEDEYKKLEVKTFDIKDKKK